LIWLACTSGNTMPYKRIKPSHINT
jgi:hypothetical protein